MNLKSLLLILFSCIALHTPGQLQPTGSLPHNEHGITGTYHINGQLFFATHNQFSPIRHEVWKVDDATGQPVKLAENLYSLNDAFYPTKNALCYIGVDKNAGKLFLGSIDIAGNHQKITDLYNYTGNSPYPHGFVCNNGVLYFFSFNNSLNLEFFTTDGSIAGTKKQLTTDFDYHTLKHSLVANNTYYFFTTDRKKDYIETINLATFERKKIFETNVNLLTGSYPGSYNYTPTLFNGKIYFANYDTAHGRELWVTDGTTAGTQLFFESLPGKSTSPNPYPYSGNPTALYADENGVLYFQASTTTGYRFYSTDGNTVTNLGVLTPGNAAYDLGQIITTKINKKLLFYNANSSNDSTGRELYYFENGKALLLKDIRRGSVSGVQNYTTSYAQAALGQVFNNLYYFAADDGVHGSELWQTDITLTGTQLVKDLTPGGGWSAFLTFDTTATKLIAFGYKDSAITLYALNRGTAPTGNTLIPDETKGWARVSGPPSQAPSGYSSQVSDMQVDKNGNSYITVKYSGSLYDFYDTMLRLTASTGNYSSLIIKYNKAGQLQWALPIGDDVLTLEYKTALDNDGNLLVCGSVYNKLVLGNTTHTPPGRSCFIAKIDTNGKPEWFRFLNAGKRAEMHRMKADGEGNFYIAGVYFDFNSDWDNNKLASKVSPANFLIKVNAAGQTVWARNLENGWTTSYGEIFDIEISPDGKNIFTLTSQGRLNGIFSTCKYQNWEMAVHSFKSNGDMNWLKKWGGDDLNLGSNITLNNHGQLLLAGFFRGRITFGDYTFTSPPNKDGSCNTTNNFIAHINMYDGSVQGAFTNPYDYYEPHRLTTFGDKIYWVGMRYEAPKTRKPGFDNGPYPDGRTRLVIKQLNYAGVEEKRIEFYKSARPNEWDNSPYVYITPEGGVWLADNATGYYDTLASSVASQNSNIYVRHFLWEGAAQNTPQAPQQGSQADKFAIFPNPAANRYIDIMLPQPSQDNYKVRFIALTGQVVAEMLFEKGKTIDRFDLYSFMEGVYFVEIYDGETRHTQKLVITR